MPVAPSLTAPGNQTTGHRLDLDLVWQLVSPTATYELQLARDAEFADLVLAPSGLTSLSYSLANFALAPHTTYYWRVRAIENANLECLACCKDVAIVRVGQLKAGNQVFVIRDQTIKGHGCSSNLWYE